MSKKPKYIAFIAHEFKKQPHFRRAIISSLKYSEFKPCFADWPCYKDDRTGSEQIFANILRKVSDSAFVLCDLTSDKKNIIANYNAIFESGIAFGLKIQTFWLCSKKTQKKYKTMIHELISDLSLQNIYYYKDYKEMSSRISNEIIPAFLNRGSKKRKIYKRKIIAKY